MYTFHMPDPYDSGPMTLDEAVQLLDAGQLDRAIAALHRVLRVTPDSYPTHLHLALAYKRKAEAGDRSFLVHAERACGEAIRLMPADFNSHQTLIEIGSKMGLGSLLLSLYQTRFNSLPFAPQCVQALRLANPAPLATFATSLPAFVIANFKLIIIVLVLLGGGFWLVNRPAPAVDPGGSGFTLSDLDGNRVSLSDFRGKNVVLLDFWATWCGPCRASMPDVHDVSTDYSARGLEVLSINIRESPRKIRAFLEEEDIFPHVLLDTDGTVARKYAVSGIPTFIVIDRAGEIHFKATGWSEPRIREAIESIL